MHTISDHSSMPVWDWKGWAVLAAILFASALIEKRRNRVRRARAMAAHPAGREFEASPYQCKPPRNPCQVCGQPADRGIGFDHWLLCNGCAVELGHDHAASYVADFDQWANELKEGA